MGNYVSYCTIIPQLPTIIGTTKRSMTSRVVLPNGEIRQFRAPVSAAELMFECPGFFLANSRSLHMGRRFSPLGADEDLELGNLYVMFPMKRTNSVITAADMAAVFMASSSASKRITGAKVGALPDVASCSGAEMAFPGSSSGRELSREDPVESVMAAAQEFGCRLASCRSKKPALETIKEEPPVVRRRLSLR